MLANPAASGRKRSVAIETWREFRRHWFVYVFGLAIPLGLYAVFDLYPIVATLGLSFVRWNGFTDPVFIGLTNWKDLLADPNFPIAVINNVEWAVLTLLFPVTLGLLLAVVFNSKLLYRGSMFRAALFLPTTMSLVLLGVMYKLLYDPVYGAFNAALRAIKLGALSHDWLGDPSTALFSLIGAFSWQYIGFAMVLFHAGLQQIPAELYEAARLDGARSFQTFRYITLPLLRPVLAIVVALTVISSLRSFDLVFVMTKGGPANRTNVLGYLMYVYSFGNFEFGYGAAVGTSILLMSLAFAVLYLHRMSKALRAEH